MASPLSQDEVRRIAALARLELTDAEVERFALQLTAIVEYAATIQEAETSPLPPSRNEPASPLREDLAVDGLDRDAALAQAPGASPAHGLFRVPKVL